MVPTATARGVCPVLQEMHLGLGPCHISQTRYCAWILVGVRLWDISAMPKPGHLMMTQGKLSVVFRNEEAIGADGPKQILSSSSRRAKQHHASVLNLILVRGQNLLAYRLWRLRSLELRWESFHVPGCFPCCLEGNDIFAYLDTQSQAWIRHRRIFGQAPVLSLPRMPPLHSRF